MDQAEGTPHVYTKHEQALIDKYRYINTDNDDWWDCAESDLKEDMAERGFTVDKMYFSGFWSQGDGACFTGCMRDWNLFCEKVPEFVRDFPYLSEFLRQEGGDYTVAHSGHYHHENCTIHEYNSELEYGLDQLDGGDLDDILDESSPESLMRIALYRKARGEEDDVCDWLKDYFKDEMRALYERLEAEYDYLSSDDAVWETIEANELDEELEDKDAEETV